MHTPTLSSHLRPNNHHPHVYPQKLICATGEGVILRKPQSLYESGRSFKLLKAKVCVCVIIACYTHVYVMLIPN